MCKLDMSAPPRFAINKIINENVYNQTDGRGGMSYELYEVATGKVMSTQVDETSANRELAKLNGQAGGRKKPAKKSGKAKPKSKK